MNRFVMYLILSSALICAALLLARGERVLGAILAALTVTVLVAKESGVKL